MVHEKLGRISIKIFVKKWFAWATVLQNTFRSALIGLFFVQPSVSEAKTWLTSWSSKCDTNGYLCTYYLNRRWRKYRTKTRNVRQLAIMGSYIVLKCLQGVILIPFRRLSSVRQICTCRFDILLYHGKFHIKL